MKVKKERGGRSRGKLFTCARLDEIACWFVGFSSFNLNPINVLSVFLSFHSCNGKGEGFQSFWSVKLALFKCFLWEVK